MIDIYLDDDFNVLLPDDEYFEFESFIPDDDFEIFIDGYYGQSIKLQIKGEQDESKKMSRLLDTGRTPS